MSFFCSELFMIFVSKLMRRLSRSCTRRWLESSISFSSFQIFAFFLVSIWEMARFTSEKNPFQMLISSWPHWEHWTETYQAISSNPMLYTACICWNLSSSEIFPLLRTFTSIIPNQYASISASFRDEGVFSTFGKQNGTSSCIDEALGKFWTDWD